MRLISVFLFVVFGSINSAHAKLTDYIDKRNKRFTSFAMVKELIKQRQLTTWVETGTSRYGAKQCESDGCSTMVYSDWLRELPGEMYSVDIDPRSIAASRAALRYSFDKIHFVTGDSIEFLKNFDRPIDFLYLDSYDFDFNNHAPSQGHHLNEIKAAYDKLHDLSVIMIDDCDLPGGGKGKLVIEYLTQNGWMIVYSGYQVILIKNI